jgi:hypothetical protein
MRYWIVVTSLLFSAGLHLPPESGFGWALLDGARA